MGVFSIIRPTSSLLVLAALILPLTEVSAVIIGKESARIVSNDPNSLEAQIAEASGDAVFCGKTVGTLNIIEQDGEKFLVGTAHSFYKYGNLRCEDNFGYVMPDVHYGKNNTYGIDHIKEYKFEMPPLNHADAKKSLTFLTDPKNLNDLVVLRVTDTSLFERQTGGSRRSIEILDADHTIVKDYAQANAFIMSRRTNFEDFFEVSYEENCQISDYRVNGVLTKLKKQTCDTGKNSSGSSLNVLHKNQIYSLGIHYDASRPDENGIGSSYDEVLNENLPKGNFFIPPQEVIKAIKKFAQ